MMNHIVSENDKNPIFKSFWAICYSSILNQKLLEAFVEVTGEEMATAK